MRIVGGTLSGRKLEPPTSRATRPMMDRVRQALFNILEHNDWGKHIGDLFHATQVLDAFCGTGALAFEAISRGATHATLFDKERQALLIARKNAAALGVEKQCTIMETDALGPPRALKSCKLVFFAPPYRKNLIPPAMLACDAAGWIAKHALIVAETAKKEALEIPEGFTLLFSRFYGDTALHFIVRETTSARA
jgi:16S rRNA (guanine966-N2)-methyltransferase